MIVIITGKSATGKSTVAKFLYKRRITSYTTRPKRQFIVDGRVFTEKGGKQYQFISNETFWQMVNKGEFFQYRAFTTQENGEEKQWYYGSKAVPLKNKYGDEPNYCICLDMEGVKSYVNFYGKENCFVVMMVSSDEIRKERVKERKGFTEEAWNARLEDDNRQFSEENINGFVEMTVLNDNRGDGIANAKAIAKRIKYAVMEKKGTITW